MSCWHFGQPNFCSISRTQLGMPQPTKRTRDNSESGAIPVCSPMLLLTILQVSNSCHSFAFVQACGASQRAATAYSKL